MDGFLKKLFRGAQEGATDIAGRAIDLFEQQPDEQEREATAAEKVGATIGDFFEVAPGETRVRDVVRELPEGFAEVIGRPMLRSFAALGAKAGELDPRATFVPETAFEKELFGTEKEISFESIGKEIRMADEEAKAIPVLDPVLGGFIAMADIASGGRAKPLAKGVSLTIKQLKALAKADDVADITKTLRSGGMKAKAAKEAARDIAKVSKQSEVEDIIRTRAAAAPAKVVAPAAKVEPEFKTVGDIIGEKKAPKLSVDQRSYLDTESRFGNLYKGRTEKQFITAAKKEADRLFKETGDYKAAVDKTLSEYYRTRKSGGIDMIGKDTLRKIKTAGKAENIQAQREVAQRTGEKMVDINLNPNALVETQHVNPDLVSNYKKIIKGGDKSPIVAEFQNGEYVVWDGHNRLAAYKDLGYEKVPVIVNESGVGIGRAALKPVRDERRFITRARALEPRMGDLLEGKKTTRSTEELAASADNLIDANLDEAIKVAKEGVDDKAVAVASRLIDRYVTEAGEATSDAARTKLWEAASEIANDAAKNLTEHGRAIQAASLLGKTTPEGMVRFAARTIQQHNDAVQRATGPLEKTLGGMLGTRGGKALKEIPELTGEQAADIVKRMKAIEGIEDELERAMKMKELTDEIQSYLPSSLYKKIINVWKAGLLTGLKTTGLNIASNTAHFGSEIIKDIPASMVDRVASLFTGKRTLAMTTKGMPKGMKEGASKGWRYWRTGFDERDIGAKLDYRKVNFGKSKVAKALQAYEETIFKTIGAQDQPFYYASKMRSLASQAIAAAKNKGLKSKEVKAFVEKMMANPTDDMLKHAVLDAETAVFQNRTTLGKAAKAIQQLPGGEVVLPFGKTPSAVATQIINYSPVGIVKTVLENIGKGKFDQRVFSQGLGRGITGTGVVAIGMELFNEGLLTLGFPTSEKERKQWELEGRLPNSIYINGKWRNVAVLGPAGLLTIIGGHFQNGIDETGSTIGGIAASAAGFGSTLTEQSFLKGVNQAISAIQDPSRSFNGFAASLVGSIIPTIIADVARSTDEYERKTTGPGERLRSRIPGVREGLEPKVDTLGNIIATQDFWTVLADPTRPGTASALPEDKPIVDELRRLFEAGYTTTPTQLGPKAGYESLTPEENTYLWRLAGSAVKEAIKESMAGRTYNRMDDEQKSDDISDRVRDVKVEARARVVLRATEGLDGKELQRKLAEMKVDKLLTKQVYEKYRSLKRQQ